MINLFNEEIGRFILYLIGLIIIVQLKDLFKSLSEKYRADNDSQRSSLDVSAFLFLLIAILLFIFMSPVASAVNISNDTVLIVSWVALCISALLFFK